MSCTDCRYFWPHMRPRGSGDPLTGDCRRYPPRPQLDEDDGGVYVLYPIVSEELWCGEFTQSLH